MAVQESVKLYILECTGTYLFLQFNLDPADSLLQCCPAEGAVLRPVHLITVKQAQACFNQEVLGLPLPLPARSPRGGVGGAAGAGRAAAASAAAGPGGGAAVSESARGTTTLLSSPSAPAAGSGAGKEAAFGDKPQAAGQGHGNGTSPCAGPGFLEDVLVEIGERTAELCPKIIRGHGIEFLENSVALKVF